MQNLISHLRRNYQIICSTDVVGFLGNPSDAYVFWRKAIPENINFGLEGISFFHSLSRLHQLPNLVGFHARCDTLFPPKSHEPIMWPINSVMIHPASLIKSSPPLRHPTYINVHNLLLSSAHLPPAPENLLVLCENDNLPGAFKQTLALKNKYDGGIYDLVHWCVEQQKSGWEKYIDQSIDQIYEFGQCLVHISWGWNKKDALPENMPDSTLKKLAKAISDTNSFPVLEFQWGNAHGSIGCRPQFDPKKVSNARQKILQLQSVGIIRA